MTVESLLEQLKHSPDSISFATVLQAIDENYHYRPVRFRNGDMVNEPGSSEGSCKVFYFAQLHGLGEMDTLALFGEVYRNDVLGDPAGDSHPNIRNFILDGWLGVRFDEAPLAPR